MKALIGYGGGKGGDGAARTPVESPNTLISPSYAHLVDLLCEGEVEGFVGYDPADETTALKSIYLNGVPVRNQDGSYNYKGVTAYFVPGTQSQEYIPGFADVESEISVAVEVTHATPIVRTVTDPTIDAVVVTVEIPQLYHVDNDGDPPTGDMLPTSVEIAIDVQSNGGGYVTQSILGGVISGKCTKAYDRAFRIPLAGAAPWDIKVRRVTIDNGSSTLQNQTFWKSYTEVIDSKLSYPNSCLVALEIPASQFNSIPSRSYLMRGLKVKVPTNYDPATRTYTGVWDGTFKIAWTDNPAWCFYDLLTTSRYGLGTYLDASSVDKWGLYTIGQYCDEYVPTGRTKRAAVSSGAITASADATNRKYTRSSGSWLADGFAAGDELVVAGFANASNNGRAVLASVTATDLVLTTEKNLVSEAGIAGVTLSTVNPTEPRFRCNLYLQTQEDAYRVVNDMASIFRALPYWASGAVQVAQDSPADSEYLFTPANVVDGRFTYSSSAKRARHTVAIVTWNDPANHFAATREYVTDEAGLALLGYQPVEVAAFGCSSQGQAQRVGRWLLFTERLETDTVTFKTGFEGAKRNPGTIITLQDPYRAGKRMGGRIVSATTTTVELDADFVIEAGKTYTLAALLPDGTLEEKAISGAPSTYRKVTVGSAFSQAPAAQAMWVITASDLAPLFYRVLSVTEEEPGIYQVTALRHEPGKYALVENGTKLQDPPTSIIPSSLAPANLVVGEALYKNTSGIKVRLQASWDQNPAATKYAVRWRQDSGNWSNEELVDQHFWEHLDITPGTYWVQVQALIAGLRTDRATASYTVLGKTAPPADVSGLVASVHPLSTTISWSPVADLDFDHYEVRSGGTDWASATPLTKLAANSFEWGHAAAGTYTFRVKAVDTSANFSVNAASVTFTVATTIAGAVIADGSVSNQKLLQSPSDNLVPNWNSELGAAAAGLDPEGNGLVNDPTNALDGNWCRKYTIAAASTRYEVRFTGRIPCTPGDQFYAEARVKGSAAFTASQNLFGRFYDKTGAAIGFPAQAVTPTTSYQLVQLPMTAPASAVAFELVIDNTGGGSPAGDVGKSVFVDAVVLRRMVTFDLVAANTLRTSNYAEDISGNPTAGAKLDNVGTAAKFGTNGMQVGSHLFDDTFFRAFTSLDGSWSAARAFYRGNNDPTVRGGAPNIDRLTIYANYDFPFSPSGTFLFQVSRWTFVLQPQSADDNLDAMRYVKVTPYHGTSSGATAAHDIFITVPDRLYFDPTDTNTGNAVSMSWDQTYDAQVNSYGGTGPFWYLLVTLYNAYGPSSSKWFTPASAVDGAMGSQYTSPFTGGSSAGGGGGGGTGFGGTCPAPEEPILLADGRELAAGSLRPGMRVRTQHEQTLEWGDFEVQAVSLAANRRFTLKLQDGRRLVAAWNHPVFKRGPGFVPLLELRPGDVLEGTTPGVVASCLPLDFGPVVKITIAGAHTYVNRGLLSHNIKQR
jgi:predicted phage tail protein